MQTIKIKVPATSANLGPGFDVLGVALDLYNYLEVSIANEDKITYFGSQSFESLPQGRNNLIHSSISKVFEKLKMEIPKLELKVEINIPTSRGLGSSSSAIIAGVFAGNLLTGEKLSKKELLDIANEIEGHPDNIAPCLLGGMITSLCEDKKVYTKNITTSLDLKFVVVIPNFELSTEKARKILPKELPYADVIFNLSHLSFFINGLMQNDAEMIKIGMKDQIHEKYRSELITGFKEVKNIALANKALSVVISGAGPTILALTLENEHEIGQAMQNKWKEFGIRAEYKVLKIDTEGTKII